MPEQRWACSADPKNNLYFRLVKGRCQPQKVSLQLLDGAVGVAGVALATGPASGFRWGRGGRGAEDLPSVSGSGSEPQAVPASARSGRGTGTARVFQISRAYSATVRSMEKRPMPAVLRMDRRAQAAGWA